MAKILMKTCSCCDWPCCEHADDYALTGEDAIEAMYDDEYRNESDYRSNDLDDYEICPDCGGILNADVGIDRCHCPERDDVNCDLGRGGFVPRTDYEDDTPLGRELGDGTEVDG